MEMALLDRLCEVLPGSGIQLPRSHSITVPPPYSPLGMAPFERRVAERVVLGADREPLVGGIEARALGDRPALQDAVELKAEIPVQARAYASGRRKGGLCPACGRGLQVFANRASHCRLRGRAWARAPSARPACAPARLLLGAPSSPPFLAGALARGVARCRFHDLLSAAIRSMTLDPLASGLKSVGRFLDPSVRPSCASRRSAPSAHRHSGRGTPPGRSAVVLLDDSGESSSSSSGLPSGMSRKYCGLVDLVGITQRLQHHAPAARLEADDIFAAAHRHWPSHLRRSERLAQTMKPPRPGRRRARQIGLVVIDRVDLAVVDELGQIERLLCSRASPCRSRPL